MQIQQHTACDLAKVAAIFSLSLGVFYELQWMAHLQLL
eukprot:SAG11_NODE_3464_length_2431_cov_2.371355_3_plen_38_part_00